MDILHTLWQDALAEGHVLQQDLINLKEVFTKKLETLLARPAPLRALFKQLREHQPILVVPGLAVVSKYEDVLEVLSQEAHFTVAEIYAKKMERETGAFLLSMGDTPEYHRQLEAMQYGARPEDLDGIRSFVATTSDALVEQCAPLGRIDVVGQLSRVVPSRLVATYFGTPGPDEATRMRWMRAIFRDIFLNLSDDTGERNDAIAAARELDAYLDTLIATRKIDIVADPDRYDDFLCRLLKRQQADPGSLDDRTIRNIQGGTVVAVTDTNSKAMAQALDQLLDRPDALLAAHQAACADDDATVAAYVFEALRFNPQNPFLLRHCAQDYVVAKGTPRAKNIPAGSLVIVGTSSAMFDEEKFTAPETFRTDRPAENYIHYGYGQHTCFGRYIAAIMIPGMAKSLLRRTNLRRAQDDGHIVYDGAFPDRFLVEFGR